jgi:hypothetical protein
MGKRKHFDNMIASNFCEGLIKVGCDYFMCEISPKCKDKFGVVTIVGWISSFCFLLGEFFPRLYIFKSHLYHYL